MANSSKSRYVFNYVLLKDPIRTKEVRQVLENILFLGVGEVAQEGGALVLTDGKNQNTALFDKNQCRSCGSKTTVKRVCLICNEPSAIWCENCFKLEDLACWAYAARFVLSYLVICM